MTSVTTGQYVCQTFCSKIIEVVLFNRISTFLQSSSNQFGFKPKHGTELCVFAFKELLCFYKKTWFCHARRFFGCLEGFFKLESRGVPTYILRLLSNELI